MKNKMTNNVASAIEHYPSHVSNVFKQVRQLIAEEAASVCGVEALEETLKWGEPSYLAEGGSTIRMNWMESKPERFSLYFNCNSKLVPTFRELFGQEFNFDGNRAMSFNISAELPEAALRQCISMALRYHSLKKLPLLGA